MLHAVDPKPKFPALAGGFDRHLSPSPTVGAIDSHARLSDAERRPVPWRIRGRFPGPASRHQLGTRHLRERRRREYDRRGRSGHRLPTLERTLDRAGIRSTPFEFRVREDGLQKREVGANAQDDRLRERAAESPDRALAIFVMRHHLRQDRVVMHADLAPRGDARIHAYPRPGRHPRIEDRSR